MANIEDYILWRGDLTVAQAPFNNVDNPVPPPKTTTFLFINPLYLT